VLEAAKLLALVVLFGDDYLQLKPSDESMQEINPKVKQFFQINLKLPLELQNLICNLTLDCNCS